jgi:hypothetical protein
MQPIGAQASMRVNSAGSASVRERFSFRLLTIHQIWQCHDAIGPVAEVSTQEQCIALHPGSSPGRASKRDFLPEKPLPCIDRQDP